MIGMSLGTVVPALGFLITTAHQTSKDCGDSPQCHQRLEHVSSRWLRFIGCCLLEYNVAHPTNASDASDPWPRVVAEET